MQIAQSGLPGCSAALLLALSLLVACGDGGRNAGTVDEQPVIAAPGDAAAHVRSLYFAQDYESAAGQGERLLARFPQSPELAAWHVLSLARSGDTEKARALADGLLESRPDSAWSRFALGAALMWNRESSQTETLDATAKAYAANPEHHDFVWVRAESLRLRGGKDETVAFLDSHAALLSASPELLNVRTAALFDIALGDPSDEDKRAAALEASAKVRLRYPANVNANYEPGWFLRALGRPAEAYPLLKTAASLSRATRVQGAYWHSIVTHNDLTLAEKRAEADASMSRLLDSPDSAPDLLPVAAAMYEQLGLHEKQIELEERVLADYPQSRFAEQVLMARIFEMMGKGAADQPEFRDYLREFLAREPIHDLHNLHTAQHWLFNAIKDEPDADATELFNLVQAMSRQQGRVQIVAHSEGAIALASRKVFLPEAERLATDGLAMVPKLAQQYRQAVPEPDALPDPSDSLEASMRDALGWVWFNQGRDEDAEGELLAAHQLDAERPSVLLHLATLYESRDEFERAETFFIRCAALPMGATHPCVNVLHDYYVRRQGSSEGFDAYLDTIRDRLAAGSKARVLDSRLPQPEAPPSFSLTSLDGRTVSLDDLKGKFAIIKFWAVWCAPCRMEMPPFADLAERFANVPDVEIVTINFDPNPDMARHWLQENGLDFEVLVDDGYGQSAGISAIPRTWFLDAEGRKVFDALGVTDDLENEYAARLDMLRSAVSQ